MHLTRVSSLSAQPVTVEDLKTHSVIQHNADDTLLGELIDEATEQVEADTGRALVETTWQLAGEAFPGRFHLPKPPLIAVDSIQYIDTDGAEQTLPVADYQVLTSDVGARIAPAPGKTWPAVQADNLAAVTVEYRSGYVQDDGAGGTTGSIPARARQALLIWAAHLYENREHVMLNPGQLHTLPSYRSLLASLEVDLI